MIGPVYTGGVEVIELDIEHIVARPVHEGDLVARFHDHIARIDALLAQSRALRAASAAY